MSLVHTQDRILVKVDRSWHMGHTFSDGTELVIEKDMNNLDGAYTRPTFGYCISGKGIPENAIVLFHFNAAHDVNRLFNNSQLSGEEVASGTSIYSMLETECFLWKNPGENDWNPIGNFVLAERVFRPYSGAEIIQGIEPELLKDTLYIKTGELAGKVCFTLKSTDYRLIFRNEKGIDEELVRCRHSEDPEFEREEIVAISGELTSQLKKGKLLIGINAKTAKKLNP